MVSSSARLAPAKRVETKAVLLRLISLTKLNQTLTRESKKNKKRTAGAVLEKVQQGGVKQSSRSHSGSGEPEHVLFYARDIKDPLSP